MDAVATIFSAGVITALTVIFIYVFAICFTWLIKKTSELIVSALYIIAVYTECFLNKNNRDDREY